MDKLIRNNWFLKLISFLVALMLYAIVALPENQASNGVSSQQANGVDTIENVELVAYYDEEKYIVSGLPETVNVHLDGSSTQVFMTKIQRDFEVYVDLEDLNVGTHVVRVKHRGLDDGLTVSIQPETVTVTIEEKVSKNFPVDIDFLNEDRLPEGYNAEDPIVTPTTVTLIGSERQLNEVAYVRGVVDLEDAEETIKTSVPINVYDASGNEITGLSLAPTVVDVEVPIVGPNKTVPIKINQKKRLPDGLSIESITTNPETVTVYGSEKDIEKIEYVEVSVDLSNITEKTTLTLDVPLPDGVELVEPETVEVVVDVGREAEKTVENVPLHVNGLADGLHLNFIQPENGLLDVAVKGTASTLEKLTASEIKAYVDVTGLGNGEHTLPVKLNGPQYLSWEDRQVTVIIRKE